MALLGVICWSGVLRAQVQLGMSNGNYNVMEAIRLNPAAAVDPIPFLDIHVVGAHAFIDNNYLFFPKNRFNVFQNRFDLEPETYNRIEKKHIFAQGAVSAFGFNLSRGKSAFGFMVSNRHVVSVRDIPFDMLDNLYNNWDIANQIGEGNSGGDFRMSYLAWTEFTGHYGRILWQEAFEMLTGTVRPKLILGTGGYHLRAEQFDYQVLSAQDINITDITARYAQTQLGFNQGMGLGMDLGVQYKIMTDRVDD